MAIGLRRHRPTRRSDPGLAHVIVIDGVFDPDPDHGAGFAEVDDLEANDAAIVQIEVRRRIFRASQRRGGPDQPDREEM